MKGALILFYGCLLTALSCNEESQTKTAASPAEDSTLAISPPATDTGTYAIQLTPEVSLSLQQWDSTISLQQYLGKPQKEKTTRLDENSDTFSGSYIRQLEWPGLKLKLFSPQQNGKTFWIQEIILTSSKYATSKGIRIGDSFTQVQQAYPALQKFPGVNENMYYVADEGYEKSIEMEFANRQLKLLRMYYMMN